MRRVLGAIFVRWLTRPARTPRALRALVAFALAGAALLMLAAPPPPPARGAPGTGAEADKDGAPRPGEAVPGASTQTGATAPNKGIDAPAPGELSTPPATSSALVAEGRELFDQGCSACHGMDLRGRPGMAPSLIGVGAGPVEFYLSTGRMPLTSPKQEPLRTKPVYEGRQQRALVAYVASFGGPPAPQADPSRGDLQLGLHEFTLNCAGCHQVVGRGGLTLGAAVPDLQSASATQIAEAVRMGPYVMPHFDSKQIDQFQLDSIARYVLWTRRPSNRGGWGIYNIGPIPEGIVAWFLGLAALVLVARLIGERMPT
jgi:quinol---cytochrome-c reductase cytochrome c subunit